MPIRRTLYLKGFSHLTDPEVYVKLRKYRGQTTDMVLGIPARLVTMWQ